MNIFQAITADSKAAVSKRDKRKVDTRIVEDWQSFNDWHSEFVKKRFNYFGVPLAADLKKWFDLVQQNHELIRKRMGGVSVENEFVMENIQLPAVQEDCKSLIDKALKILPTYLDDYKLIKWDLLLPTLDKCAGIRTSKHLIDYGKHYAKLDQAKQKSLEKLVGQLGEKWAQAKMRNQRIWCTLSTSAKAFAMLGHYGPDDRSCFGNYGANTIHRYHVGSRDDTFILLLRDTAADNVQARCWGWMDMPRGIVNFTNFYAKAGMSVGNALQAMKKQAASLLKVEADELKVVQDNIATDKTKLPIYLNKDHNKWTFYTGKEKPGKQVL